MDAFFFSFLLLLWRSGFGRGWGLGRAFGGAVGGLSIFVYNFIFFHSKFEIFSYNCFNSFSNFAGVFIQRYDIALKVVFFNLRKNKQKILLSLSWTYWYCHSESLIHSFESMPIPETKAIQFGKCSAFYVFCKSESLVQTCSHCKDTSMYRLFIMRNFLVVAFEWMCLWMKLLLLTKLIFTLELVTANLTLYY